MKILENVLQKHEKNRQKIISSLEKNRALVAKKLVEEYVEFSYVTILDNITKAQVAFSQNANNLLDIEQKELNQLEDFKTIKKTLIQEQENLEEKIVVLDSITTEQQQYRFDLNNLENELTETKEKLLKEQNLLKLNWKKDLSDLDEKISKWETDRSDILSKEEEQRRYEHDLKLSQINDAHEEKLAEINREQELKSRSILKDIAIKKKVLEENEKLYQEAKVYIDKFEENLSVKVAKQIKIKLGFMKQDHENNIEREKRSFLNELDILDLKIENRIQNSTEKRETIKELKEKLAIAKVELNTLTQNTLSVKG